VNETAPAQPAEVDAFFIWYLATNAEIHEQAGKDQIDNLCPGIRTASRQEQKRFGTKLIEEAVAGRLPFRPDRGTLITARARPHQQPA
jgi:hypothetical protein